MNATKLKSNPPKRGGWLRTLLWIGGILVVLLVVAYFAVGSGAFVKGIVLPRVAKALNADLTVGAAEFSPFSSLVLRDVKLTPKGAETLLTAGLVRARYGLFSIIGGKIAVEELTIESPTVTIVEGADGRSNLDPLLASQNSGAKAAAKPSGKSSAPPSVNVKLVALKNATVRRTKNLKGGGRESVELSNVNLTLANLKNGATGKLDLSAAIAMDNTAPGNTGNLQAKLDGSFTFDLTQDLKPAKANGKATFTVEKAAGNFAELAALVATVDCDATPTEVKQLALSFTKSGEALGQVRVSGPFDAAKSEGKLNVAVLSLDRRVLNLAGAASGIDFGTTVINSTNVIELTKGGAVIAAAGQLDAARVRITRQGQTTPTLDLRCDYDVTTDRTAQSALLKVFNLTGTQDARPLLQAALSSPMTIAFGNASSAVGDAALNFNVTGLNLADWRAFATELAPAGSVNLKAKLLSQQGGKQLTFDLDGNVQKLAAKMGAQTIQDADVKITARGIGTDLKQFKLDDYRLEVAQQGQSALTISGSGTLDRVTQDADFQVLMQAGIVRLLAMFPQPDAKLTGGTVELKGRLTSKKASQSVTGKFALAGLKGSYGNYRFADFGSTMDLDVGMKDKQVEIRKASGELHEGATAGGKFDLSGSVNQTTKAGQLALKLVDFNQDGLRPFLESALGDKKLVSVSVNSTATANIAANGDAAVKADLQLANLVVSDPKGSLPATPLEAKMQVDAGVAKSVAQIRQCQLTLTPTARAKNVLQVTGSVDFSKTNAITGNLKLAGDSLDATRYYDLFGDNKAKPGETTTTTTANPTGASDNKEPEPVKLPFSNFTLEAAIGRFYLREVDAQNFQLVAKFDGGHVLLKPAQLTLNGAPITATADLDLSVPGFKYDVTFSANGVPVAPLANSFSEAYRGQAKGTLIANGNFKGAGITGRSLRQSLSGNANLNFTNANIQIVGPKMKAVMTPIAFVLGAPEVLRSPLDYLTATLRAGGGKIEVPAFVAHSESFRADSQGVIPIADVLNDSPLNQNIEVSLARNLANKLRFSNVPTNEPYMKLPTFVHLKGTLGSPDTKTDKLVILGLTTSNIGGAIGGDLGGKLGNLGSLLGGRTAPAPAPGTNPPPAAGATNAPASNVQPKPQNPVGELLDLFKKPKK